MSADTVLGPVLLGLAYFLVLPVVTGLDGTAHLVIDAAMAAGRSTDAVSPYAGRR